MPPPFSRLSSKRDTLALDGASKAGPTPSLNLGHALFCYFRPLLNCSRPTAVRTSTVNSKNRQAPISVVVVDSSRQYYDRIWYYRMYW